MTLSEITEHLRERASKRQALNGKVLFDLGKGSYLHLDGTKKNAVSNEKLTADCTITISQTDFVKLIKGELNPTLAFWSGKMQISGSYILAMQMQGVFL